jgi:hypothetical protein
MQNWKSIPEKPFLATDTNACAPKRYSAQARIFLEKSIIVRFEHKMVFPIWQCIRDYSLLKVFGSGLSCDDPV